MTPTDTGRKWAVLASFVVVFAISGVLWALFGGCERTGPAAPDEGDAPGKTAVTLRTMQAMNDEHVKAVSLHVAWYFRENGALPPDFEVLAAAPKPAGWPPLPTRTATGQVIHYAPTGPRTFRLVLDGPDGQVGTPDDTTLAQTVPADLPRDAVPESFRIWWDMQMMRSILDRAKEFSRP